ncbi:SDR family NAD(P)-dependent oxidoreductase [Hydrocarboniphaga sp.]|uniref:SDR family NAD(P)-dependent oxidoreductase n=1 Tax=Hydrocarboniphaga sp. TaxID=2033016 RepID=UPI003D0FD978
MNLSNRTAVVSGGSSGIGKAIVSRLHAQGWSVYTCGRDATKLAALARELPGVTTAVCDVSDRLAVRAFASAVAAAAPSVDFVVSNAGGLCEIDFTRSDLAGLDLSAELRNNTEGAINLIAEFLPGLRAASRASVLIVSSGYGLAPATRAPVYSASKAALHSLSKSLRRQFAPLGIAVTELIPPVVDTPATAHHKVPKLSAEKVAAQAVDGALKGLEEVRPGAVRFLPMLLRLAPRMAERVVAKT